MESELITQAKQGNTAAYEQIVRQEQDAVFRLAYLILGDADDAQDVAQDTFIRAHRYLHRLDPDRPIRPWLLQIAKNLARNHRRALGYYWNALNRVLRAAPHDAAIHSVEIDHEQRWEVQALWDAIRQLPQQDQEVIYLRYMLELSTQETAEVLQVQPGTVKSRLSRALRRLREVVQADFPLLAEGRQP